MNRSRWPVASTRLSFTPRRAHLHCARPTRDLPGLGLTVADHQPPPARVASLLVGVHILGHLDLQGCHQHPPSTLPGQVVQRRSRGRFFRFRRRVEYLQHGWRLLSPACQPASHVDYAKGYAAFFTLPIHNFGLYLFARTLVHQRGWVGDEDIARLRRVRYGDDEIAEIVANVAVNLFSNYFTHVADTVVDFPEVSLSSRRDVGPEGIVDRVDTIKESQAMKLCS